MFINVTRVTVHINKSRFNRPLKQFGLKMSHESNLLTHGVYPANRYSHLVIMREMTGRGCICLSLVWAKTAITGSFVCHLRLSRHKLTISRLAMPKRNWVLLCMTEHDLQQDGVSLNASTRRGRVSGTVQKLGYALSSSHNYYPLLRQEAAMQYKHTEWKA